jgi:hypothetical protein
MISNPRTARATPGHDGPDGCRRALASVVFASDLERRIVNVLHARGVPGLAGLQLHADRGHVILKGTFPSPRAQWLCVECCRHVPGVIAVVDLTSVDLPDTLVEAQ